MQEGDFGKKELEIETEGHWHLVVPQQVEGKKGGGIVMTLQLTQTSAGKKVR